VSIRKLKEVLRLRFGLGLQQSQIARSCSLGQATLHRYLHKAAAAGLSWPLPEEIDDRRLEELLFPAAVGRPSQTIRPLPDFAEVRRQLQIHKHLTLQLVWEEYRETQPEGYGYSRFCELYERWRRNQDVVLREEHRAGEKMFVDWAQHSPPRPAHRRDHTCLVVRRRSRRQHVHLCARQMAMALSTSDARLPRGSLPSCPDPG